MYTYTVCTCTVFALPTRTNIDYVEGRSRGDRDRSSLGRLMAEGPSTFMEYERPLGASGLGGGGRGRRNTAPRKNITATVK